MQTKLRVIQRGTTSEVDVKGDRGGGISMSPWLPAYAQLSAAGKVFAFQSAGTAIAPVTAVPTTAASWGLYNANAGGGPHLVLLKVAFAAQSGTLGLGGAIIGTVAIGEQSVILANYTTTYTGCLDGTSKAANAFLDNATTLVGTQSPWVILATTQHVAAVSVGAGAYADVDGLMVCPPHGTIGLDLVAPTGTTALFDITVVFAEVQLDLA